MNKGNSHPSLQVKDFYQKAKKSLKLKPAFNRLGFSKSLTPAKQKGEGDYVLIWGKKELKEIEKLSLSKRKNYFKRRVTGSTICIIVAEGGSLFSELEEVAKKKNISVFFSELSKKECLDRVKEYIDLFYPEQMKLSGGLLKVLGLGVLIIGDSGIGKSESALELISRGYTFISDDVTLIRKSKNGKLIGSAPSLSQNFMEIRGLGIINIKGIFGEKVISSETEVNLVIKLEKWKKDKEYDRLGLESLQKYSIMGLEIPQIIIPVAPGRNIATLIEVACKIHSLKEKGYIASLDIVDKLNQILSFQGDKGKLE